MSHKREMASQDHIYQPGEYFNKRHQKNKKNGQSEEKAPEANEEFLLVDNDGNAANDVGTTKRKAAKRKQNFDASSSTVKKQKKWSWSAELVEKLLIYVKEYKTQCEFNGIDFEADLQSLYTEVRSCMATEDPCEFGPQALSEQINPRDMEKAEYEAYKSKRDEEKKLIRKGYDRIKEKIKNIRQDYRAAVNKGTRSGSGKIVQDNYDLLTDIWGGSPATTSLPFGVDGMDVDENDENEDEIDVVNVGENFDDSGLALEERLNEGNILAFQNQFHCFNHSYLYQAKAVSVTFCLI